MNLQEQIRDYLKRAGKQVISLVEEDIEFPRLISRVIKKLFLQPQVGKKQLSSYTY
ncbi:hypothetical protein [Lysinibacillus fusiformis]|uniref:hypothetical protein n=1 Tax=Lysinibacillus fusiformis TaxID=28031 RepID=UPI003CEF09B9